jgi:hypothetical protein
MPKNRRLLVVQNKLRVSCKGENIPFPLMPKGESTKKGGYFQTKGVQK